MNNLSTFQHCQKHMLMNGHFRARLRGGEGLPRKGQVLLSTECTANIACASGQKKKTLSVGCGTSEKGVRAGYLLLEAQ